MSTATATAYRSRFAGRIASAKSRKSPEIKPFHGRQDTYSRKAHCIKDRVLLDIFFFDWFLLCRSTFFPNFYPEVKALLDPQLFGYNKKDHLIHVIAILVGSAVLAGLCVWVQ